MHSGGDPRPWVYGDFFPALRAAMQLRSVLMPYIYAAGFSATLSGLQPVRALYYEFTEEPDAYAVARLGGAAALEYAFGDALVVAPITGPASGGGGGGGGSGGGACGGGGTNASSPWAMWVPPGAWVDWWQGTVHNGPAWLSRNFSLLETPLMARAGAVIPMKALADSAALAPVRLQLAVAYAPASAGGGLVYEDDGESLLYVEGAFATLKLSFTADASGGARLEVARGAAGAGYAARPCSASSRHASAARRPRLATRRACTARRIGARIGTRRVVSPSSSSRPASSTRRPRARPPL